MVELEELRTSLDSNPYLTNDIKDNFMELLSVFKRYFKDIWKYFFEYLNIEIVLSPLSNKEKAEMAHRDHICIHCHLEHKIVQPMWRSLAVLRRVKHRTYHMT